MPQGLPWTAEEDTLLLSLIHNSKLGGCCKYQYTWKQIADRMAQSGISTRRYTKNIVFLHYSNILWPQAAELIQRFQVEVQQQIDDVVAGMSMAGARGAADAVAK
jgi:hypothetical protein